MGEMLVEVIPAAVHFQNGWKSFIHFQRVASGHTDAVASVVIKGDPEALAMFREAMKHQGESLNLPDNIREVAEGHGTSKAYTLSRLQKESPELFTIYEFAHRQKLLIQVFNGCGHTRNHVFSFLL